MPHRRAQAFLLLMIFAIFVMFAALIVLMTKPAWPADARGADPYACFGGGRYVAMAASFQCADLPSFCGAARSLLAEAGGNEREAERLARSRGHSRMAIALAHRFCKQGRE